ncbi:hypothetical protein JDV02_004238 [Purpureocillium takamizusanense]|uniref:F-box domain-containing protein n=1 Tax=Purpureocillium takamizusanense TaxID=2060973 RepID=A0A9Q8V972_9HYPO|nr:uncharacterized protein JDV02_004238 [Purpureocillium takamizusanense]UNI17930.1 hypothetical protein JDV02_004238 [Purpureocillium takamizusanense]
MATAVSTLPVADNPSCFFDALPTDVILTILTSLNSLGAVENVLRASRHARRVYLESQAWIIKKLCKTCVYPANMDVAFITLAMLRIHPSDIGRTIDLFSQVTDAPWVVVDQFLDRKTLQLEFLRLADHVNQLAEVYARAHNPEWFWRQLALKFNRCWPRRNGPSPLRFNPEQVAMRTEVATQVWRITEGIGLEALPKVRHSPEMLQLIQRSFWTRELSVRGSLLTGRLKALGEPISDLGMWFEDEAISSGVNRFLRLLTGAAQHLADVNSGKDLTLVYPHAREQLWEQSWLLGSRLWARMVRWPRPLITTDQIDSVIGLCDEAMAKYVDDADGTPWYFESPGMSTLFVRRLADGRMKRPLEHMRGVFFNAVVQNRLVMDVEDWRELDSGSAE